MKVSDKKRRVLIIQGTIPHYRIPIFNEINKHVDLTVLYNYGELSDKVQFNVRRADVLKVHYRVHKMNLYRYIRDFDVVIMMLDSSYLATRLLGFLKGKVKLIFWGIGVSAAYDVRYNENPKTVEVFSKYIKKADAALFYAEHPIKEYIKLGIPKEKMFVANNTVEVLEIIQEEKSEILFVGTLYKAKKIYELLNAYYNAYLKNNLIPNMTIVGDGEEMDSVKAWISEKGLEKKITLTGAVFDEKKLSSYFAKALVCISPDQAGLSVLKSFGYGVPFITHKNAITGGERLNIIDGENGVLLEDFADIEAVILDCADNNKKYIEMGANAKRFYEENRTIVDMAKGFLDAIEYVTK